MLSQEDCIAMCMRDTNLDVTEKDVNFAFGYCQMTVVNEERQWKTYHSLQFVEFLEFVCRLAHLKFRSSNPELASQPLVTKLEFLLDDLCQGYGLTRNEVNIEVAEFSESDDDY